MASTSLWTALHSVGHAILDEQHEKILRLCGQMADCLTDSGGQGLKDFHEVLNDLCAFSHEHLEFEEAMLKRLGYPGFAEHEAEHLEFRETISELLYQIAQGMVDRNHLCRYLTTWWNRHILESDMEFKAFLVGLD